MSISFLQHKGKKVVFIDYSHCKSEKELLSVLFELRDIYKNSFEKFLTLSDFTGTFGSRDFMKEANKLGKELFDAQTKKSSVLGITGIRKILLQAYNKIMKNKLVPFKTKEEALEYLVS